MTNNGVDKVREFHRRWDELAEATAAQYPDVDVDWLFHGAIGLDTTDCDPDTAEGGVAWIA